MEMDLFLAFRIIEGSANYSVIYLEVSEWGVLLCSARF
jgi:hypothetical protein